MSEARGQYAIRDDEVQNLPVGPVDHLRGILKYDGPPATLEDMERAIVEGACRKFRVQHDV